jgi:hypothetical protein
MAIALKNINKNNFYDNQKDSKHDPQPAHGVNAPYLSPARL